MKTLLNKEDVRSAFSERLKLALEQAGYPNDSPTVLCRIFNQSFSGMPITVHAARKWMVGEAIPTQEKVVILAAVLQTTPNYLMWGEDAPKPDSLLDAGHMHLLLKIRALSDEHQDLVTGFIDMLSKRRQLKNAA